MFELLAETCDKHICRFKQQSKIGLMIDNALSTDVSVFFVFMICYEVPIVGQLFGANFGGFILAHFLWSYLGQFVICGPGPLVYLLICVFAGLLHLLIDSLVGEFMRNALKRATQVVVLFRSCRQAHGVDKVMLAGFEFAALEE